jgi:hypothetical protein
MPLERRKDWPQRLDAFIAGRRNEPFAWGVNDCALFAADAVLAITGTDLAAAHRGYNSAAGAMAASGSNMAALAARIVAEHQLVEIPPAFAQRGDIGLAEAPAGLTVVVRITDRWVAPGKSGLDRAPVPIRAWAIGRSV